MLKPSSIAILTDQPFWLQPLGSATLLRSRWRVLSQLSPNVEVIFFAGSSNIECPLNGATIKFDRFDEKAALDVANFLSSRNYDALYCSYDSFLPLLSRVRSRKIIEIHDVLHLRQAAFEAFGYEAPIKRTENQELANLTKYDAVICLS